MENFIKEKKNGKPLEEIYLTFYSPQFMLFFCFFTPHLKHITSFSKLTATLSSNGNIYLAVHISSISSFVPANHFVR